MTLATLIWYGARVCLVAMFPFSAIDKVWHWRESLAQTQNGGLPGAKIMLVAAIAVEAITPLMIVAGWHDRLGAFIIPSGGNRTSSAPAIARRASISGSSSRTSDWSVACCW